MKVKIWGEFLNNSFAALGEDRDLEKILGMSPKFYVDIGANHPIKGSLTYRFYRQGGQGIIVEPNIDLRDAIKAARPRDLHLQIGLGSTQGNLKYFRFEQNVLNTFSEVQAEHQIKNGVRLLETVTIPVRTLSDILVEHGDGRKLDLVTCDAEGFDLDILKSNDWVKFRPRMVLVEHFENSDIDSFFSTVGYKLIKYYKQYGRVANALYRDGLDG
ncbi:MAG: FkbM family methyltransferase [Bdellovibrionales bacterium]